MKKIVPRDAVLIPDSAERVFKGVIYDVYQWQQPMFDDSNATFEMLKRPDTVTIIPIVGRKILTIEDDQPHSGARLSFPGGRVDKEDENGLGAAKREVKEETGYEFENWKLVKVWQPHTKLEWFIYFYVAWNGQETTKPELDSGERIKINQMEFNEVKSFVVTKTGYLGESKEIFDSVSSLEELINLPEFEGKEADR